MSLKRKSVKKYLIVVTLFLCSFSCLGAGERTCDNLHIEDTKQQTTQIEVIEIKKINPVINKCYKITKLDTSFKAYMPYDSITDVKSKQYELRKQAKTDENGLRKIEDYYCVAVGIAYSKECGKKFEITLDSDIKFKIIVSDIKNPIHCDKTNSYTPLIYKKKNVYNDNGVQMVNITEFLVDENKLSKQVKKDGSVSCLGLDGNIVKIEEIVDENTNK